MIDDQKLVYAEIFSKAVQSEQNGKKRTIIVQGGPGTGKTIVAINLLANLIGKGLLAQYASKNAAPRAVYGAKLTGSMRRSSIDNLFKGTGCFIDAKRNSISVILADEAHRLNDKSGMCHNLGENQIKEIIYAARCSVFFIDESQRVTTADIGSVDEIEKWARLEGSEIINLELTSQFRCNGSDGYLSWLDNTLQIRETANESLDGIDYEIRICDTPQEMERLIREKNRQRNRSRIIAGYCWEWPKESQNNPNCNDIQIGDYGISWNLKDGQAFALDPKSIDQAGCIHTTQGLEFDYVGVIIGNDMNYSTGQIVTDDHQRAKSDQSIKGLKKLEKKDTQKARKLGDEIIKNTYRTLMTRGMKGCFVYACDAKLREYLKQSIQRVGQTYDHRGRTGNVLLKAAEGDATYPEADAPKQFNGALWNAYRHLVN